MQSQSRLSSEKFPISFKSSVWSNVGCHRGAPPLNTPKSILLPFTLTSWGSFCDPKLWELVTIAIICRQTNRHPEPQTGGKCVCWVYVYKIGINGGQRISHHLPPNKILPHPTNISISQGLRHFTSPSYLNCLNGKGVRQKCLLSYFTHHHPRTMECLSSALMTTLFTFLTEFGDDDSF